MTWPLVRSAFPTGAGAGRRSADRRRPLRWWTVLAVVLGAFQPPVAEAQTLDRSEISGTIQDETGAALGGVSVTLLETSTGFERTRVTTDAGRYSVPLMPPGVYVVRAERPGFSAATSEPLTLSVGQALVVDVVMKVAGLAETVSIAASGDIAPALGAAIGAGTLSNLPVNGRDYRDAALLSPTARAITGTRGTFRVAGQPGDYLALNVDGADFTNNFFGEFFGSLERQNFTIPLEAVQEFEVSAGGLGVQSGRSNGGLVNVVTKSGSNQRHGSLAYSLRHHALTANDAFGNAPAQLVRHIASGSIGGPIVSGRTFYFGAADVQRQTTPITVKFARSVAGVPVPELGIADLRTLEGQYPRHENVTAILAKFDHGLTTSQRLSTRLSFSRSAGDNIAGGGTILSQATSNLETFRNQGLSVVTSVSGSVGSSLFLETKLQTARETRPRSAQSAGPQVQISDTGTFGRALFLPGTQDMYRYQVSENAVYVRGNHDVRFGGDYNGFNMRNNAFALALSGGYVFPTLEAFIARQPLLYAQNFGLNGDTAQEAALLKSFWQHEAALYVQDRLRPTARLTIGIGLRYDMQINPQPQAGIAGVRVPIGKPLIEGGRVRLNYAPVPQGIPDDRNNWGPRGDVAYQLADGRTVLKGSAGLYYGRTPMIYFPMRGAGVSNTTLFVPVSRVGVTFPQVLPSAITPGSALASLVGPPAIAYVDPGFENPRVLQMTASLTRRVAGMSVEAAYLRSESRNLRIGGFRSTSWDRNLAPPTQFDAFGRGIDILAAARPDSTIGQANALTSFGRGRYQALVVSVSKPMANRWQVSGSYTLAKSMGNGSTERDTEALFGPSDPFNPDADFGINELDERHQFKGYLVLALPGDTTLASTWTAGSGLAFPVYSATDLNRDGVTNDGLHPDRPVADGTLLARFPYHQPAWAVWDVRAAKGVTLGGQARMHFMLEVFNLLNAGNTYSDPRTQAILGSPNFRVHNRTLGPRLAQLGVRFDF
ncbi:MAG: carboxypeptidase regulatory-like domain-containing protein [Vicinamibacterales bacterium]